MTDQQEEALAKYRLLDELRQTAKQNEGVSTFGQHPLDRECCAAWDACIEVFGSLSAVSDALYAKPSTSQKNTRAVAAPKPPRTPRVRGARDPRIPPPGTKIYKRDRHGAVLAEAIVTEEGIEYAGEIYGSPSAAGFAAATALGLEPKAIGGYAFWGLNEKP